MKTATPRLIGYALLGLLVCTPGLAGDPGTGPVPVCPNGLIEGPDPIGRICVGDPWGGAGNGTRDVPDTGNDPSTGAPYIFWAEGRDGVRDIAFSMWSDGEWGSVDYVATSAADERGPVSFAADDGAILVSWWAEGSDGGVFYARRDPRDGDWSPGVRVDATGQRPSIAVVSGRVVIVFERLRRTGQADLVAVVERADGTWTEQTVRAGAGIPGSIDSHVHHEWGRTWVEWKSSSGMAWSEWVAGRWSRVQLVSSQPVTWKAVRSARDQVRERVLGR